MSLSVVDAFLREGKVIVTVEGSNPEEVATADAKRMAITKAASCGYPNVGYNATSGAYPVDKDGKTNEDWNKMAIEGCIVGYRNDIILMPRL